MKNLMDIDFYDDNWDKTSFTLSDYTNIGISIILIMMNKNT